MDSFLRFPLEYIPFILLVAIIAFTIHEYSHAYLADKFGDPGPRQMGRVTLNPIVHIDIFGLVLLVIAGIGWAKPVLVSAGRFKKPRWHGTIVAAAGPFSHLILAFLGAFLINLFNHFDWLNAMSLGGARAIVIFLFYFLSFNLVLFLLNIIPLPPLDGYLIIRYWMPYRFAAKMQKYEQWAPYVFLLLVFIPPLRHVTIDPLFNLQWYILDFYNIPLRWIFGYALDWRQMLM
ncbi:site-2 protease family protein [Paenibacillus athensensis]|uniref:Peptidase M50 domain-containing protein n=1 Tax=Paenibacillus athensensis TaxID=1967502 RepID=A0A4Y8PUB3_9BACL|nr:site-2 protease family protein [Paenibacillus athensensis]MCD1261597.1 site-2 protease family protein [Paenibacillus athensensis]